VPSILKLALRRGLTLVALSLLMRGVYPKTFSVLAWLDSLVAEPEAIDPTPPVELPFGPLRPPPELDWAALPAVLGERIHTLGPTEVIIERQALETILANLPPLVSSLPAVPVHEGNRVVGVRVFGIHPDTLLGMLNLENGDVLERVGAYELGDPDQALQAYTQFRRARDLSLQISRRNTRVNIHYAVR
jgi:hypothetical protein